MTGSTSSSSYIESWSSSSISSSSSTSSTSSSSSTNLQMSSSSSTTLIQSSSSSSSSSSSRDFVYRDIRNGLINENHCNLIPFTWIGETGTGVDLKDNAKIPFIVQASNSAYVEYQGVIDGNNEYLNATPTTLAPTVYVPQNLNSKYQHENEFYVDVIARDNSGIKEIRTHVEPDKYQFENVNAVFYIPKFSWDNSLPANTSTTTTESSIITTANSMSIEFENTLWLGTESGVLREVKYKKNPSDAIPSVVSNSNSVNVSSYVYKLLFSTDSDDLYISSNEFIYIYGAATYLNSEENYHKDTVYNNSAGLASLYDGNVWSVQPYEGNVVEQSPLDLSIIKQYTGMDAPFKVVKSQYHNTYFISGSHILWRIDGGIVKPFYQINDYSITDFDVMEGGQICILFHGTSEDIIRIVDNDLYGILLDERITQETLRYCKACNKGKFYILSELNIVSPLYPSAHYVFDINSETLQRQELLAAIVTTTSTTTAPVIATAVKVLKPDGGETIQTGTDYEIQWATSKSINDNVKIELYKGGNFYSSIVDSTSNSGVYKWNVSTKFEDANTYKIKITWISASSDPNNYSFSDNYFSITSSEVTTTTTTSELVNAQYSVGIDYDSENDLMIFALKSGLFGIYHLPSSSIYGMIDGGISNVTCMAFRDSTISKLDMQSKVRIFVGSEIGISDKWDSGEIETSLTSCYYGGGNNLQPGKKYYVQIQTYSDKFGWSEVQVKEFVMVK